ncbi:MAG TPA: hypothetical protein VEU51_03825 [Candidatus Acidoferrales bacterium]|nr:hypothetical protein [Candidatus Acidoferrales bacterium]
MAYRNFGSRAARTVTAASAAIALLGLLALAGCSSSPAEPTLPPVPAQSDLANSELHIYLDQCKQLETGLYKCPAFEKSICDPEYAGQATCVRVGKKGSIFVQSKGPTD